MIQVSVTSLIRLDKLLAVQIDQERAKFWKVRDSLLFFSILKSVWFKGKTICKVYLPYERQVVRLMNRNVFELIKGEIAFQKC